MDILAIILSSFMLIVSVVMFIASCESPLSMKSRIDTHNRNVVRKYNYNSDIAAMWIRSKDFLKSKNGGEHPCDSVDDIELIDYIGIYNQKVIQER